MTTVYGNEAPPPTPPRPGIPVGVPLLGYTSGAMYDGLKRAARVGGSGVGPRLRGRPTTCLLAYFPADVDALGDQFDASLAGIPDGSAETGTCSSRSRGRAGHGGAGWRTRA